MLQILAASFPSVLNTSGQISARITKACVEFYRESSRINYVDPTFGSALYIAARTANLEMIELLIKKGADLSNEAAPKVCFLIPEALQPPTDHSLQTAKPSEQGNPFWYLAASSVYLQIYGPTSPPPGKYQLPLGSQKLMPPISLYGPRSEALQKN